MAKIFSTNKLAVSIFSDLAEKMTGNRPEVTNDPSIREDLIILGSEEDNAFLADMVLNKTVPASRFRSGTDDYLILSLRESDRNILVLAGGRTRAQLYAIYAYFEELGCGYFWDGDVIPHRDELLLTGFKIYESPRFQYRGLRYFAHRSLHRFQAEHWTLEDWKKEIDWILKKRLNLFMLRIGHEDLFQKAFPDIVPYPKDNVPCDPQYDRSYNDRTHFWSMEERSKLRKDLLQYAFERDLIHPEDTGTMSHWYSRTPAEFLEKEKPEFVPQSGGCYSEPSGLVWDIRKDKWLDDYFKLTQAHIDHYGNGTMFHTIGLAERGVSNDPAVNHAWKLYVYRRIIKRLRKDYPSAPLLLASWDFWQQDWTSDKTKELFSLMDPVNTLLLDYTSDTDVEKNNFIYWNVVGKFPWIFGIFQAFEPGNELRGNYPVIKKRLEIAKSDPYCKGMIIWPENSHGDTLMYEYFAANAWNPDRNYEIREFLPVFCRKRYGKQADIMLNLWMKFLPIIERCYWSGDQFQDELFGLFTENLPPYTAESTTSFAKVVSRLRPAVEASAVALKALADCPMDDPMIRRDAIDMARTAAARLFQYLFDLIPGYSQMNMDLSAPLKLLRKILYALGDIVKMSPEFSLNCTMDELKAWRHVNPIFEHTLKGNAERPYCRSFITELFEACYKPEFEVYANAVLHKEQDAQAEFKRIQDAFYDTPLEKYRPDCAANLPRFSEVVRTLAGLAEECEKQKLS